MSHYDEWLMSVDGLDPQNDGDVCAEDEGAVDCGLPLCVGGDCVSGHFDMVLCLVDFQMRMFQVVPPCEGVEGLSAGRKVERDDPVSCKGRASPSAFERAIICVRQLYRDKGMSDNNDKVALVLYNTRECTHADYLGVYVFHSFCSAEVQSALDLEELIAAGTVTSPTYSGVEKKVGHSTDGKSHLSDALRLVEHLFAQVPSEVKHRRVFLFSNDADPHRGDLDFVRKCTNQIESLSSCGVGLVFYNMGPTAHLEVPMKAQPGGQCAQMEGAVLQSPKPNEFWNALNDVANRASPGSQVGVVEVVHLGDVDGGTFGVLLRAVRCRTHPRRATLSTTLTIGVGSKGVRLPKMVVGMYFPTMNVYRRLSRWLDGRASEMAMLQLRAKGVETPTPPPPCTNAATSCSPQGGTVQSSAPRSNLGAGVTPYISENSRKHIAEVVCAGLPLGFSVICFKSAATVLRPQYIVGKSCVLHPEPHNGADGSFRLFVRLFRALLEQEKVAIALHVARHATPPRLFALVPPGVNDGNADAVSFPLMQGVGLYVVPLAYADDFRVTPQGVSLSDSTQPGERDIAVAHRLLATLPSKYDVSAVRNPALELRYRVIERIARCSTQQGSSVEESCHFDPHFLSEDVVDCTWGDREIASRHVSVFNEFKEVVLSPGLQDAEKKLPGNKPTLNVRTHTNLFAHNTRGAERTISAVESAYRYRSMDIPSASQLKHYLEVMEGDLYQSRRNNAIIEAVRSRLQNTD